MDQCFFCMDIVNEIKKLSRLAYIDLSSTEEEILAQGLENVLHWMQHIEDFHQGQSQIDIQTGTSLSGLEGEYEASDIKPWNHTTSLEDRALLGSASVSCILVNAPQSKDCYFVVPKIIS